MEISSDDVAETSNVEDSESDAAIKRDVKLYKISDATGSLQVTEVSGMPLTQDMLNPEVNVFECMNKMEFRRRGVLYPPP